MELSFTKMQGCANDYIYLDCRNSRCAGEHRGPFGKAVPAAFFHRGGRHHLHLRTARPPGRTAMMRIFNADGSEGRMCGNGIRCVAEWLYTHGVQKEQLAIDTLSGLKTITRRGEGLWQVEMGGLQRSCPPACPL